MALQVEDLEDQSKYRQILEISYHDLIPFILDYLKRISGVTIFFWSVCLIFLGTAIRIRMNIAGYFPFRDILFHSVLEWFSFHCSVFLFMNYCILYHITSQVPEK